MLTGMMKLLTKEATADGHPLFANAAKLGETIVKVSSERYKNPKATAALISLVFRGARPCSKEFRAAILAATRERLSKLPKRVQDDWVQRVGRSVDLHNTEVAVAQKQRSQSDEEQFDELLHRAMTAEVHFIITPMTAEEEQGNLRAEKLNDILLQHLGLVPKSEQESDTHYDFLLPDRPTANKFWTKLRGKAEKKATEAKIENTLVTERLKSLSEQKRLEVYEVPCFVCGCPIVVYDPERRYPAGFSFSHHENNIIDTIKWDFKVVEEWKKNVYEKFDRRETDGGARGHMAQEQDPTRFTGYRVKFDPEIHKPH